MTPTHVIIRTAQGAYIGGTLWASSPDGKLFVKKDEICLDVDCASNPDEWEKLPKSEPWQGMGEVVVDPRLS